MKKIFILFSFMVTCLFAVVPNSFASSPLVISEEKAGSYQYKVIKEQETFTCEIEEIHSSREQFSNYFSSSDVCSIFYNTNIDGS